MQLSPPGQIVALLDDRVNQVHRSASPATASAGASLALVWGLGGVLLILSTAVWRLAPIALEALRSPLEGWQWAVAALWVVFMAWSEGHRGFHQRFSPTAVARAYHLASHPRPLHLALAPLYCMGFFHGTRRRLLTSWILTAVIVGFVVLVRLTDQPWRGIIDLGVVVGLTWGMASLLVWLGRARRGEPLADPQVPATS